jgi:hypothetical protein
MSEGAVVLSASDLCITQMTSTSSNAETRRKSRCMQMSCRLHICCSGHDKGWAEDTCPFVHVLLTSDLRTSSKPRILPEEGEEEDVGEEGGAVEAVLRRALAVMGTESRQRRDCENPLPASVLDALGRCIRHILEASLALWLLLKSRMEELCAASVFALPCWLFGF